MWCTKINVQLVVKHYTLSTHREMLPIIRNIFALQYRTQSSKSMGGLYACCYIKYRMPCAILYPVAEENGYNKVKFISKPFSLTIDFVYLTKI